METGIIRDIDKQGRIRIPKKMLNHYGWKTSDSYNIFVEGDYIVIEKYKHSQTVGAIRKPDNLGSITIPAALRRLKKINGKTPVEFFTKDTSINLKVIRSKCMICDSPYNLSSVNSRKICINCINKVKNIERRV